MQFKKIALKTMLFIFTCIFSHLGLAVAPVDAMKNNWVNANADVAKEGGWRAYAKAAQLSPSNANTVESTREKEFVLKTSNSASSIAMQYMEFEVAACQERLAIDAEVIVLHQTSAELTQKMFAIGNINRLMNAKTQLQHEKKVLMQLKQEDVCLVLTQQQAVAHLGKKAQSNRSDWQVEQEEMRLLLTQAQQRLSQKRRIYKHHVDVLLPLQATIDEENGLMYNGMFIGSLALISEKAESLEMKKEEIEAKKEMNVADLDVKTLHTLLQTQSTQNTKE